MCAVSATIQYWQDNTRINDWNWNSFNQLQEILRRLEKLDEALGQKDCIDPAKQEWMDSVEQRLRSLEAKKLGPFAV